MWLKWRLLPFCLLLACLFPAQLLQALELPELIDRIRPSVVGIGAAYPPRQPNLKGNRVTYRGTGFAVGDGLHIVTNAHVLPQELDAQNNEALAVFSGSGSNASARIARVVRRDEVHDLVLLEIRGTPLPALQLGDSSTVREGQDVVFTGFPIGMALGLYPVTHRGMVAAITPMAQPMGRAGELSAVQVRRMRAPFKAFQLDATAYPGNSGSPVFDLKKGRVIGVVNSVMVKESKETMLSSPSGITYAIPVEHVHRLLAP